MSYEYDEKNQRLIKTDGLLKIIEKNDLAWRELGEKYEPYARAIYLGQGCWELLETITDEQAQEVLKSWGYSSQDEN